MFNERGTFLVILLNYTAFSMLNIKYLGHYNTFHTPFYSRTDPTKDKQ